MPLINYLNPAQDSAKVSAYSATVLEELMDKAGIAAITITSTARTASEQARVMYENIERHGAKHQKNLYGPQGDKVIDVYTTHEAKGQSKSEIVAEMTTKITNVGASNVSRHAGNPAQLNVVDIASSSISLALRKSFEEAVNGDARVSKFLTPPGDRRTTSKYPSLERRRQKNEKSLA